MAGIAKRDDGRWRARFFDHCAEQTWVSTKPSSKPLATRIEPGALHEMPRVTISFSELTYLFECPYSCLLYTSDAADE